MKRVSFSEKQPDYRYFPLADGNADVFVYNFIGEDVERVGMGEEETETKVFLYDVNEFRMAQDIVTEDMVKANPADYLDYTPPEQSASLTTDELALAVAELAENTAADKLEIEMAIAELAEVILNG